MLEWVSAARLEVHLRDAVKWISLRLYGIPATPASATENGFQPRLTNPHPWVRHTASLFGMPSTYPGRYVLCHPSIEVSGYPSPTDARMDDEAKFLPAHDTSYDRGAKSTS